jgi:hypothetical protein
VRLGVVRDQPNSSAAWRARPLWTILGDYGIDSGIVRWPLTYPAQPMAGFLVTDRFHQMIGSMFEIDGRAAYPPDLLPVARDAFAGSNASGADVLPAASALAAPPMPDVTPARWDVFYSRAMRDLTAQHPVQLEAVRYQGIDTAGHYYLRYAEPSAFADVSDAERQQYGGVLDRYYAYVDGEIGAAIERLAPGDLLLVLSGFGMQPVSPIKHMAARLLRDPDVSGTHENAPDGFMIAYGTPVMPGRKQRPIVDVTPTVLYFLGVPIGRDMTATRGPTPSPRRSRRPADRVHSISRTMIKNRILILLCALFACVALPPSRRRFGGQVLPARGTLRRDRPRHAGGSGVQDSRRRRGGRRHPRVATSATGESRAGGCGATGLGRRTVFAARAARARRGGRRLPRDARARRRRGPSPADRGGCEAVVRPGRRSFGLQGRHRRDHAGR